jgi:hypothetical protein
MPCNKTSDEDDGDSLPGQLPHSPCELRQNPDSGRSRGDNMEFQTIVACARSTLIIGTLTCPKSLSEDIQMRAACLLRFHDTVDGKGSASMER